MEKVTKGAIRYVFVVFCLALIMWTSLLTMNVVKKILPDNVIMPYLSLILYDFGSFIWLQIFLYGSRGNQKVVAFLMMIFDILGVAIMSIGDIWLSQTFTEIPQNLGIIVIWSVSISTVVNAVAGMYIFHLVDPDVTSHIKEQQKIQEIMELAESKYSEKIDVIAAQLGEEMAAKRFDEAVQRFRNENINTGNSKVTVKSKETPMLSEGEVSLPEKKRGPGRPRKQLETGLSFASETEQVETELKN